MNWFTRKPKEETDIGTVLMKMGVVNEEKIREAREKQQHQRMKIGEIMIDMGYITSEQLANALHAQKLMRKGKYADAMLEMLEKRTNDIHAALKGVR